MPSSSSSLCTTGFYRPSSSSSTSVPLYFTELVLPQIPLLLNSAELDLLQVALYYSVLSYCSRWMPLFCNRGHFTKCICTDTWATELCTVRCTTHWTVHCTAISTLCYTTHSTEHCTALCTVQCTAHCSVCFIPFLHSLQFTNNALQCNCRALVGICNTL